MVLPWPTRQQRRAAISAARREKEQALAAAALAAELQARVAQANRGRTQLRVTLADPIPTGRMDCPVLQGGQIDACPVFLSGRLTD